MVKHFEHVGVACSNIEKSIEFYCDFLGLKIALDEMSPDGTRVVVVNTDGGGLELFGAESIRETPAPTLPKTSSGIRHFAFAVSNMAETHAFLKSKGVEFAVEPRKPKVMPNTDWIAFCRDPDGNLVELVERK